jgi:hypothetical protein
MPTITESVLRQVALWTTVAFVVWVAGLAVFRRLGLRVPAAVVATLSWFLARLLMWWIPNVAHWRVHR